MLSLYLIHWLVSTNVCFARDLDFVTLAVTRNIIQSDYLFWFVSPWKLFLYSMSDFIMRVSFMAHFTFIEKIPKYKWLKTANPVHFSWWYIWIHIIIMLIKIKKIFTYFLLVGKLFLYQFKMQNLLRYNQ